MGETVGRCPVCRGTDAGRAYGKDSAVYRACRRCRLLYQDPFPTSEEMRRYAEQAYLHGAYADYVDARDLKLTTFRERIERVRRFVPNGILLDIGAASGFLVDAALEAGFDSYGIEFSENAIARASSAARPRIRVGNVETYPFDTDERFDVVTAFDIIEHSHAPVELLRKVADLLSTDGLLVLTTPDIGHFLRYLMRERWPHLQPMQHTVLFSQRSIRAACTMAGLDVVEIGPAKKTLTVSYLAAQIQELNPLIARAYAGVERLVPTPVLERPFGIDIGEMFVIAKRGVSRSESEYVR